MKKPQSIDAKTLHSKLQVVKPIEPFDGMWERIAQKAYEIYKTRGKQEGHALEDWLQAEAIVMEESHDARK